jgi:hypothetical protein
MPRYAIWGERERGQRECSAEEREAGEWVRGEEVRERERESKLIGTIIRQCNNNSRHQAAAAPRNCNRNINNGRKCGRTRNKCGNNKLYTEHIHSYYILDIEHIHIHRYIYW